MTDDLDVKEVIISRILATFSGGSEASMSNESREIPRKSSFVQGPIVFSGWIGIPRTWKTCFIIMIPISFLSLWLTRNHQEGRADLWLCSESLRREM